MTIHQGEYTVIVYRDGHPPMQLRSESGHHLRWAIPICQNSARSRLRLRE